MITVRRLCTRSRIDTFPRYDYSSSRAQEVRGRAAMPDTVQIVSYVVLLGGTLLFGFLRGYKEMGIWVLAGFLGMGFLNIDKMERFRGAGFEAVMRDQLEAIVVKETEPDVQERQSGDRIESYGFVGDESPRVVKALMNPTYTWRNVSGISKESGVSPEKVQETLDWLLKNGLAKSSQGAWALTEKGREVGAGLP